MNRMQKIAWFNLVIVVISGAVVIFADSADLRKEREIVLIALFGGFVITVLLPLFFRKKLGKVSFDERDARILKWAWLVALGASYGSLGGMCIAKWFEVGLEGSISVHELLVMYLAVLIGFVAAKSVMVLIYYGWGGSGGGE